MDKFSLFQKAKQVISSNALLFSTIVGALSGFIIGVILKPFDRGDILITLVGYPGELFMRALQLCIVPVVISSLIAGSSSINIKTNGKIAMRTFLYFITTSLGNAAMGLCLVLAIQPGDSSIKSELQSVRLASAEDRQNTMLDNFLDLGRNVIPSNIFSSFFEMTTTVYTKASEDDTFVKGLGTRRGTNALGVIFFSLAFGTFMSLLGEKVKALREVVEAIDAVNMKAISCLIWLTPVGVASLICAKVLEVENMGKILSQLFLFIVTVAIGIAIYQFIIIQLIYFVFLRKNPFPFYIGVLPGLLTGFAADSSAAALPVTMRCLDELGIDSRISHFVVPIGVTCNMDGTALFITISSVFIAQMNDIALTTGDYASICIIATAISVAAATAPSASLTLLPIALAAIGAPIQDVGLLFAIDWLCDRIRTTNNVLGDCYASAIVEHWSQDELREDAKHGNEEKVEMTNVLSHHHSNNECYGTNNHHDTFTKD